ncbi:hypothetical protein LOZ36_001190 [Ophidiomyces ophidiicola]|nr:hypothetical protein LOZ36_001190 [Ophidiomyces ophidiicola]
MPFNPVHFIPASKKDDILALPVQSIAAAGHEQNAGTNHWCLFARVSPTIAIRIDCQPSYSVPSTILPGGSKGNIIISWLNSVESPDIIKTVDLAIRSNLLVRDVYNVLLGHGRHKYEFDSNGVGCRYWVTGQLDLLQQQQILVNPQEVAMVKETIQKLWPEATPLALDQGAYYQ